MAGVFYKHTEWNPVADSPHQEEVAPVCSVQSCFKILLGFEHHNECEVILTCEDLGIKERKNSDFKSLKDYPVFAHKVTPFRLKHASFNTTLIPPIKNVCF